MEPPSFANYVASHEKIFLGSSTPQESIHQNQKRHKVVLHDLIETDDPAGTVINEEKYTTGNNSNTTVGYDETMQKQIKDALVKDPMGSKTDPELASGASLNPLEISGPGPQDLTYLDDIFDGYSDSMDMDDDDMDDDMDDDIESSLDAQFDGIDLPPGVEGFVPWLEQSTSPCPLRVGTSSSSTVTGHPSYSKTSKEIEEEIMKKYREFKQFDTVRDYSDHHYTKSHQSSKDSSNGVSLTEKAPKEWKKKIQQEWKILEKDLPETIFVRSYEERMDFMRAVIVGAAGTPYHDGLFFFDIFFPPNYPGVPPKVHYHSGGLRLNPNLYAGGKVCLSLLNTWNGKTCERWTPGKSTMLQVLVSIQGLVLNAKPYFNEPGFAGAEGTPDGEKKSLAYNEDAFLLSLRTMLYTLQRPPKHFEDFVTGHFYQHAHPVLQSVKAYMKGAQVGGCLGEGQDIKVDDKNCYSKFKTTLGELFPKLLVAFTDNGADCREFIEQKPKSEVKTVLKLCPQNVGFCDDLALDLMDSKEGSGLATGASLNTLKNFGPRSKYLSNFDKYYDGYSDVADMGNDFELSLGPQFTAVHQPPWVGVTIPCLRKSGNEKPSLGTSGASSSKVQRQPSSSKQKEESKDKILMKFRLFKRFDTVCDYSDHYNAISHQSSRNTFQGGSFAKELDPPTYKSSLNLFKKNISTLNCPPRCTSCKPTCTPPMLPLELPPTMYQLQTNMYAPMLPLSSPTLPPLPPPFSPLVLPPRSQPLLPPLFPPRLPPLQPLAALGPKQWAKKIQQEWKILENNLPESIFVRVYEERRDLLRAVIVGAAGTPYHDGLFFFDISFPSSYPNQPPVVYYHSGGLGLNPNLYTDGSVCLSLLNTWFGDRDEQWTPGKSTILQVLISIQALVLNAKPYFNEPGCASTVGTPIGEKISLAYNEKTFLLSCKTMLYTLQRPPKHFKDFVVGHFLQRAHAILEASKAYMDGAQVGCLVNGVKDVKKGDKSCSSDFKNSLGQLFPKLLAAFADNGADCRQSLNHKVFS
ncbi:uncharacterized protein LOC143892034 [Tasmannia lanceolata]|uniref:uncharacterized protein LOC143892034 n=1 Tax=Tasmannia lanceolata TaxID=3420 RepID=UPI0040649E36